MTDTPVCDVCDRRAMIRYDDGRARCAEHVLPLRIRGLLSTTDCTKCNFMRRTDPIALCPFHDPNFPNPETTVGE